MAKRNQRPGEGLTPDQQDSLVHLGRMLGDVRDDFDREVKLHRVKVVLTGSTQVEDRGSVRVTDARRRPSFAEKPKPS
jgi:hypothetical protein